MSEIHKKARVAYSPTQMYDLVNDIEAYPQFLSGCVAAKLLSSTNDEVVAELTLEKKGMSQAFTTRNKLQPVHSIEMILEEGPFKYLNGLWLFNELEGVGCEISLDLDFKFSNQMWAMMLGSVFNQVAGQLVDAFVQRAEDVYR